MNSHSHLVWWWLLTSLASAPSAGQIGRSRSDHRRNSGEWMDSYVQTCDVSTPDGATRAAGA